MLDSLKTGDWYHYRYLSDYEKKIYMEIYRAISNREKDVSFSFGKHGGVFPSAERMVDLVLHVLWDNPKFFWFDATNFSYSYKPDGERMRFRMVYTDYYTPELLSVLERTLEMRVEEILRELEDCDSDYEKLLFLYTHLMKQVKYMDSVTQEDSQKNLEARTITGPLLNHLGVCAGFTKVFKLICDQLGIGCFYLRGQVRLDKRWGNHGWNAVYLDGEFYHVDITYDSALCQRSGGTSYHYFLKSDEYMEKERLWDRARFPAMPNDWFRG